MSKNNRESSELALLQEIAESLRELVIWTRITGYSTVKQTLETVLDSDEKRLVYHLTDGRRSVAEIQKMTGVNARFISEWGQEWERMGIAIPSRVSSVKGRRQRAFDPADFELEPPKGDSQARLTPVTNYRGEK
jgi:hypothetical protein